MISGLLLVCSVSSLLLFLQLSYFGKPPGIDGQAMAAALSGNPPALQMCERFTAGTLEVGHLAHFTQILAPAILFLTAMLAVWNYNLFRRQS